MSGECSGQDWEARRFHWADYLTFGTALLVSVGFGIFHGFFAKRKNTTAEFFMGDRQINFFSLGLSLTLGFASSVAILGNVAEMYNFGTQFALSLVSTLTMVPFTLNLFLPVFRELEVTSVYEYLDRRFGIGVRLFTAILYILQMLIFVAVVVYAPALALRQVTGIETMYAVAIIFAVGIFYSSLGGLKAAVGTDIFQFAVLMTGVIALLVRATMVDGGPQTIWNAAYESDRLELFIMNPDPRVRHTFWSVLIGTGFYWVGMNSGQATFQRLLAVPTQRDAAKSLMIAGVSIFFLYGLTFYFGLMAYAHFQSCDPLLSKSIDAPDQIYPLYMMEILGDMPGLAGLLVSGIFSASLGTLAMSLNGVSANILRDILDGGFSYRPATEERATLITRLLNVTFGLLSFGLTFIVAQLGSLMQIAITFNGVVVGVTLAVFTLAMYVPWSNSKGVLTGSVISFCIVCWLAMGAQVSTLQGELVHERKEVGLDCECDVEEPDIPPQDEVFDGYRISYLWYTPLGWFLTVVISTVASLLWDNKSHQVIDPNLLAASVRSWFIKKFRRTSSTEIVCESKTNGADE